MKFKEIPNLTFPSVNFSTHEIPWDLRSLLFTDKNIYGRYLRDLKNFDDVEVSEATVDLLINLHALIEARLVEGTCRATVTNIIYKWKRIFVWSTSNGYSPSLDNIEKIFVDWSEYLIGRMRRKQIKEKTYKSEVYGVGKDIDQLLENTGSIANKVRKPKKKPNIQGEADDILFNTTVSFGSAIIELVDALTLEVIRGSLPINIYIAGQAISFWCLAREETTKRKANTPHGERQRQAVRAPISEGDAWGSRIKIINLRIEAELLIFISQTAMNLQQAFLLEIDSFKYVSHIDGFKVMAYKARRSGNVLFEIFSEYRIHFEKYLAWRNECFKGSEDRRLFPFTVRSRRLDKAPVLEPIKRLFSKLNIKFINPRELRKTRLNWFLRSTQDPALVAEMAQNDVKTLMRSYIRPNAQLAMVEISRFHDLQDKPITPPAPGVCVSIHPTQIKNSPNNAASPDCGNPSGCLFCENHRDIDSFDHIWSLASFRYLKILELSRDGHPKIKEMRMERRSPAEVAVDRITEKIQYYEKSSEIRNQWVKEALTRIDEEHYHPLWDGFIQLESIVMDMI